MKMNFLQTLQSRLIGCNWPVCLVLTVSLMPHETAAAHWFWSSDTTMLCDIQASCVEIELDYWIIQEKKNLQICNFSTGSSSSSQKKSFSKLMRFGLHWAVREMLSDRLFICCCCCSLRWDFRESRWNVAGDAFATQLGTKRLNVPSFSHRPFEILQADSPRDH